MEIGAKYSKEKTAFTVWAPNQTQLSLVFPQKNETLKMTKNADGYWKLEVDGLKPGAQYQFRLDNAVDRPDPASHFQPDGVFGSSAVVDHSSFCWKDNDWRGIKLRDMVMYELHVGTFSRQGTFTSAKTKAKDLSQLGVNAVELMPVAQFSGKRNWGYDAVFPFAVQNSYGGPDKLKEFVDELHSKGIAVILDVVYNHIGPEGNVLADFAPYFLPTRMSPWGPVINFDGPQSIHVRNFFLENAVYWFQNYHVDGLRLDAIYAIVDESPKHFLKELSETVQGLGSERKLLLIGENDRVDPKLVTPLQAEGYGLDAVWHDNLHHSLHALLTGERNWYYSTFRTLKQLQQALRKESEDSQNRISPEKLIVFSQNHDQIGNRPLGDRLITLEGFEAAKLAAGLTLLTQYTPLLFMGEEYGENSPFLFFTNFSQEELGKKVFSGRKQELQQNGWHGQTPNPQNPTTFLRSKISWQKKSSEKSQKMLEYYGVLIKSRKNFLSGYETTKKLHVKIFSREKSTLLLQKKLADSVLIAANFSSQKTSYIFPCDDGVYLRVLDSAETVWLGPGSALPDNTKLGDKHSISPLSLAVFVNLKGEKING